MGFPRFYWYPSEGHIAPWTAAPSTVIKVDVGEPISDLQLSMKRTVTDSITYSMKRHRRHLKPYIEVRIILERFNDESLARELYSMESHLQQGGHVAFTADRSKTWAAWCGAVGAVLGDEVIVQGDSVFDIWGAPMSGSSGYSNIFKHWEAAGTLATGDVLQIDGTIPDFNHEELVVNSATSLGNADRDNRLTVDATHTGHVRYNYVAGAVIRYRDFFPFLSLPSNAIGKPIIHSDHRVNYTFDAVFHYYPGWMGITQRVTDPPLDYEHLGQDDRVYGGIRDALGYEIGDYLGIGDSYEDSVVTASLDRIFGDWG